MPGTSDGLARNPDRELTAAQAKVVSSAAIRADIAELLKAAERYHSTQPGHAADLRAAAERATPLPRR